MELRERILYNLTEVHSHAGAKIILALALFIVIALMALIR